MQVLLDKDVKKLGYRGDIVTVKPGYFRNFIMPNKFGQIATAKMIELAGERNKDRTLKMQQVLDDAKEALKKVKGSAIKIVAKVTKTGKLYGSITKKQVLDAMKDQAKLELKEEFIKMKPIKELGEHKVTIHLGEKLEEEVIVNVEAVL